MRRQSDTLDLDGDERSAIEGPGSGELGPQGAALILELQRLRHAFEGEDWNELRPPQPGRAPPRDPRPGRRPGKPRRKKKGKMGRVIDVCLEQFGLKTSAPQTSAPPARISEGPAEPAASPGRRANRTIVPDTTVLMSPTKPGPEIPRPDHVHQPMLIESPRLAPSGSAKAGAGELIERCRSGLIAGVTFIVNSRDTALQSDASDDSLKSRAGRSFEHELRTGLRILILVTLLAGGWLVFMPLAGAVAVPGNLVVRSNVKAIQHPTGGVVAEIKVHNGMRVAAGDLLVRLDATQTQANLQMVSKQLDELRARIARLVAERDGLDRPHIPSELKARSTEDAVRALLASEDSLFKARLNARTSQKDLLQGRVAQLTEEISGLEAQVASKAKQLELIAGEMTGIQDLYDKRLVPLTRLTTLQRETARIEGERGQLTSAIAETKSKIGEAQLQIVRLDQDFRTDVVKELGETQGKEAELAERAVAARDQLDRIEIRAPTSGVINQLSVHTIGGVIRAGDTIMEIVPDTDDLQIEARLQPNDIDQVRTGQKAFVRFSAFNQRLTPQLIGAVSYVSADTSHDQQTNAPYFTVRIALTEDELRRLGGLQLVPGMPAEVFMQTGNRTMMSYLLKPITDQLHRAFIER
ncbi:MAG: HlyD family type I secretion periplasmic adaptor subunit [Bradyrhizobium sp.]